MDFFSVQNILVHIPIGAGGYDLSWIEAVGTIAGLLCIGLASLEKISNYFFGLINVTLFGIIFFQIQLYASLLLQVFFFAANIYGWYAWSRQTSQNEAELKIRWLPLPKALSWLAVCVVSIGLMTVFINPVFAFLTRVAVMIMQALGLQVAMPELQPDAFPFWDSCMMVLSIVAMILMTRKYVENWLLWVIINVISVVIFALQGVYAMSLEYIILTFIALNGSRMWIKSAREEVHVRCPINDDDVNGQTPLYSGGSLAHDKVDIPSEWWRAQSDSDPSGSVGSDPTRHRDRVAGSPAHAASSPASRLPSIHAHGAHCGLPGFPGTSDASVQRYPAIPVHLQVIHSHYLSTVATRYAEPEATPVLREWGQQVSSRSR